jgi:hypothetical protein
MNSTAYAVNFLPTYAGKKIYKCLSKEFPLIKLFPFKIIEVITRVISRQVNKSLKNPPKTLFIDSAPLL